MGFSSGYRRILLQTLIEALCAGARYGFLLERDLHAARRAREAIGKSVEFLRDFPFSCRKAAPDNPFLREMVIPFGPGGCVGLFEIEDKGTVTILAIRHQREEDYY